MAIIQISKLQQRSGNLVDLPQLSEAEFGWASDSKRLFIGKETPNENIEVLTSYSTIDFNQIDGSVGNLNISPTVANGELLVYDGNEWVNRGGAAGGLITLGDAADITIDGGAINYVLTTDGTGNLSWTPKGALYSNIIALSSATYTLSGVAITGTAGQFSCTAASQTLVVGQPIVISGTLGGTGTITGYTDPTTYYIIATNGSTTFTLSTSLGGSAVVTTAGTPTGLTYTGNIFTLSGVQITGTAGQFSCTATSLPLVVGRSIVISGTLGGTGTITGYSNPTTYYIIATNGSTTFTLSASSGGAAITTTAGTPTGLIYTASPNTIVMTVANTTPYVNDAQVTISGVNGASNNIVNGETFYIQLAGDFPTSGNVSLYTGTGGTGPVNGTGLTYTNSPSAIATSTVGSSGGSGLVAGGNTQIQYNNGAGFAADGNLVWNYSTRVLTVTGSSVITGNANVGNLNATGLVTASRLVSNIANGTSPLLVTSTTKVTNLNADLLDGYDTSVAVSATTVVVRDASGNIFANNITITDSIVSGTNSIVVGPGGSNVSIRVASTERIRATTVGAEIFGNLLASNVYANSGTIGASLLTGTLTTAAQPNITSVGTLTSLAVTGNTTSGNFVGILASGNSNVTITANANVTINAVGGARITATSTGANITGTLGVSGNANVGNIGGAAGVFTTVAGSLTTAAQPNITSVGTLTSLAVTGNITSANVTTSSYVIRSVGTAISAAGTIQGDATALTKDINVVSTVSAGQGVRLPTAVAGMVIIVNNTSATSLNVYPSTSAAINSLATNAAYTHIASASLQYYAISATQWYTVGATYS
jgi:hypothetical protein